MNEQHEYDTLTEEEQEILRLVMWAAEGRAKMQTRRSMDDEWNRRMEEMMLERK